MEDITVSDSSPEAPNASQRQRNRKRWGGIARIVISVSLLAWLLSRVGLREVASQLANLNGWFYVLAGAVLLLSILARAVRWQVLLTPLGVRASILDLFLLYLVGFFWNSFLPTGFGGDVAKIIELRRISQHGAASATSVVAERVVGLFATSLIGLIVIAIRPGLFPREAVYIVAGMCLVIVFGVWFVRLDVPNWIEQHIPLLRPVAGHRMVTSLHEALCTYDLKALEMGLLVSVPFTLTSILDNYLVGLALNVDLTIGYYAIYTPIISIVGLLPLSFNGLGVREYAYQILFGLVGVPAGQAIAMALAFNLLRFGAGLIGGVVSLAGGVQHVTGGVRTQHE
jgi:uncharacterized protein (TIRG00374 family)